VKLRPVISFSTGTPPASSSVGVMSSPEINALVPAALDEQVGQGDVLARRPAGTGVGELAGVDQLHLQRKHPKQEVAVGVEWGHGGGAPDLTTIGR